MKTLKIVIVLSLISLPVIASWYNITPHQREVLRYYEYQYNTNQCDMNKRVCQLVELNILRIKKWFKSIY